MVGGTAILRRTDAGSGRIETTDATIRSNTAMPKQPNLSPDALRHWIILPRLLASWGRLQGVDQGRGPRPDASGDGPGPGGGHPAPSREFGRGDEDELAEWLAEEVGAVELRDEQLREPLLVRYRSERIEPPGRVEQFIGSARSAFEQRFLKAL